MESSGPLKTHSLPLKTLNSRIILTKAGGRLSSQILRKQQSKQPGAYFKITQLKTEVEFIIILGVFYSHSQSLVRILESDLFDNHAERGGIGEVNNNGMA